MRFGACPIEDAVGALTAHSLRAGDVVLRKGSEITADAAAALRAAGVESVVAVRLEPGDVGEDVAALALAERIAGEAIRVERPFTGRANLFAVTDGVLVVARATIDAVNAVDEAVTCATLPAYKPVVAGEMVGTVKIIPYAVPGAVLDLALAAARDGAVLRVAPYTRRRVGVISTLTPALKPTTVTKTLRVFAERLAPAGAAIVEQQATAHETGRLATALLAQASAALDLIVVFGASAIADRRDVIPEAIAAAGGVVEHFGMPVDPGNLILLGRIGALPVIGAPGCARSPKENGFDWVLQRLLAGLPVTRADVTSMGVGGLLMEIVSRPQPRQGGDAAAEPMTEDEPK